MQHRPLTVDELRDLINKGEASDPLMFLEALMNGQDPRRTSGIYKLIMDIDSITGGELDPADWSEIIEYVTTYCKYHIVNSVESFNAAKTLAEYLHPKRKQIELTDPSASGSDLKSDPLTDEEILHFKDKFNEIY